MESSKTVTKAPPRYHTVVHFEIPANDPSKIARFYEQLFGWKFTKMEGGNMDYWLISHKDAKSPYETLGGLYKAEQGMSQQGILNYFSVKSIDESLKQASSLGATSSRQNRKQEEDTSQYSQTPTATHSPSSKEECNKNPLQTLLERVRIIL